MSNSHHEYRAAASRSFRRDTTDERDSHHYPGSTMPLTRPAADAPISNGGQQQYRPNHVETVDRDSEIILESTPYHGQQIPANDHLSSIEHLLHTRYAPLYNRAVDIMCASSDGQIHHLFPPTHTMAPGIFGPTQLPTNSHLPLHNESTYASNIHHNTNVSRVRPEKDSEWDEQAGLHLANATQPLFDTDSQEQRASGSSFSCQGIHSYPSGVDASQCSSVVSLYHHVSGINPAGYGSSRLSFVSAMNTETSASAFESDVNDMMGDSIQTLHATEQHSDPSSSLQTRTTPNVNFASSFTTHIDPDLDFHGDATLATGSGSDVNNASWAFPDNSLSQPIGGCRRFSIPCLETRSQISVSQRSNTSHRDDVLSCGQCSAIFKGYHSQGNRSRHIRNSHNRREDIPCENSECKKVFKRQDARLKHYRKHHPHLAPQEIVRRPRRDAPLYSDNNMSPGQITSEQSQFTRPIIAQEPELPVQNQPRRQELRNQTLKDVFSM